MRMTCEIAGTNYRIDLTRPVSLAIPLQFDGPQPNHFGASPATANVLVAGSFVGDTCRGGSCNVEQLQLVPHCNGTHTESAGHILDTPEAIGANLAAGLAPAKLITVDPVTGYRGPDGYLAGLEPDDAVITLDQLQAQISEEEYRHLDSLVIRTLPNTPDKLTAEYGDSHQPPFFTNDAARWLADSSITHLLVDFPSIDKMYDDGHLSNHRLFWRIAPGSRKSAPDSRLERTVTEMIYVDPAINDGLYLLNLQIPAFVSDAAPCRPLLYPLEPL